MRPKTQNGHKPKGRCRVLDISEVKVVRLRRMLKLRVTDLMREETRVSGENPRSQVEIN